MILRKLLVKRERFLFKNYIKLEKKTGEINLNEKVRKTSKKKADEVKYSTGF